MIKPETWKEVLVVALWERGGKASLHDLYEDVPSLMDRDLTNTYQSSIRNELQTHSSDSRSSRSDNPDLFFSVYGLGEGVWGLRPEAERVGYFFSEESLKGLAIDLLTEEDMKGVQGNSKLLRMLLKRKQDGARNLHISQAYGTRGQPCANATS